MKQKEVYEKPTIEITEFELSDSIALSSNNVFGTLGNEELWGD